MDDSSLFQKSCDMKRKSPEIVVTKDVLESLKEYTRVTPTFELNVYNYIYRKHYSMETNEYLKCHWHDFKEKYINRVVQPFQFIDSNNYHFYNGNVEYMPSLSITKAKSSHPLTMKAGPGVDRLGQRPIPLESFTRKSGPLESRPETPLVPKKWVKKEKPFSKVSNIDGKTYKTPRLCRMIKEQAQAEAAAKANAKPKPK